jgi:quinol monooxygenase YgiN
MIAVLHFRPSESPEEFQARAQVALAALSARPGFIRGTVGLATDDGTSWVMVTEWESVGAYRRGLGGYEVKMLATPLMAQSIDQPSAFETLLSVEQGGELEVRQSDRAPEDFRRS